MLRLSNIEARYGAIEALRGVNLTVQEGEIVALLGANGAGKSTTLKVISGLLRPTAGEVHFLDQPINLLSPRKIASLGIIQIPEGRRIFPGLTVLDNLKLGASNGRIPRKEIHSTIDQVLNLFPDLRSFTSKPGWTLSGGQQQMLAIGRALMAKPGLLLLDEPSLGLSPVMVQQVFKVIKILNDSGTTILLVEQNATAALRMASKGYVLENGATVLEGPAADLLGNPAIQNAYLGKAGIENTL